MNIGFDLDKIFIDSPIILPEKVVEMLYRKKVNNHKLEYRIPARLEEKIRLISHHSVLRPPLKKNIDELLNIKSTTKHDLYLISSRFNFLKECTDKILIQYKLIDTFRSTHFNLRNEQPHIFKERIVKKLNIEKFIDDDLPLLEFLSEKNNKTVFYWFNKKKNIKIRNNLLAITSLESILQKKYDY